MYADPLSYTTNGYRGRPGKLDRQTDEQTNGCHTITQGY